jgi:DNA-directed RNA polymerase specialized sigma24 family protein
MAKADTSSPKKAPAEAADEPPSVAPLTRRGYERTKTTQRQITAAMELDAVTLVARAQQRDEKEPDYLSAEALVYFIRRADGAGDSRTRNALIRELLERCNVFFRGQFRGCSKEDREDLQGEVMTGLIEDLFDPGDRGDFMQARFWLYLKRKTIDASKAIFRHAGDTESLDTGFSGEAEPEGQTKLDAQVDIRLNPEELMMLSEALAALSPRLRQVFLLRHHVGMKIGADDPADDPPNEVTLARRFDCSGRTIRNWLKEAEALLARFREK